MTKWIVIALAAAIGLVPMRTEAADVVRVHSLPGSTAFPESIGADSRTGEYFIGSLIDGSMYRGSIASRTAVNFLPAGSDGRTSVAGVKIDNQSRVWVANAFGGRVLVYNENGLLLHTFVLVGPGSPVVNDLVFSQGLVYVTDSTRPFLYRLVESEADDPGLTEVEPWISVEPPIIYHTGVGPFGINLNGIVASPDGRMLLANQTNTGILWRIDVASKTITQVRTPGADLQFGDGMLRLGDSLYVVRNAVNQLLKLRLNRDWTEATPLATVVEAQFAFPTAVIELRGSLLVTNAQLNVAASPTLPFTVIQLPMF